MAVDQSTYHRGKDGSGLVLHEILQLLDEDDVLNIQNIGVCPPEEPPDAETDKDSDLSDEEVLGEIDHLPSRILRSRTNVRYASENESDDEYTTKELPSTSSKIAKGIKRKKSVPIDWKMGIDDNFSKIPDPSPDYSPTAEDLFKENIKTPIDAFFALFSDALVEHIVSETNKYAAQKLAHNFHLTKDEILTFIGVMLLSGYHSLPYRRLYWKLDPDVHVALVANSIRRNRFDEIMSYLHLADNQKNDGTDILYKVRPLFDLLNSSFKQISPGKKVSIDESIIAYYGRHGIKQFIRGKPIRFGYKLWVAADPSGYIHHAEPYCGASTRLPETGFGQGGDVVLGLVDHMQLKKGTRLYFDNLFTSIALLQELTSREIGGTGTLRENRCTASMQLPDKKKFKNKSRGEMSVSTTTTLCAVRWNDNSVVTVLTNCDPVNPMKKTNRYSRTEKKKISVDMPGSIAQYNSNMGGVDLSDQFLPSYRCRIRSKKWWWAFFAWGVDVSCVQGWNLYRRLGHDIPLLEFRRQSAIFLLKSFGSAPKTPGVQPSLQYSPVLEEIRKDRTDHIVEKGPSKYRRCKICGCRTTFLCKKCDVPLHPDNCFKVFHNSK